MILQHLIAGLGDLRAVLLQAGQDREVTLIDHLAAEVLDIARAGRLLFGVPLRPCTWASALPETGIASSESARKNLFILFLFVTAENPHPRIAQG